MLKVVEVTLDPDLDFLLSQMSADLEMSRDEVAKCLLESSLTGVLTR
jgi:hypothetical protein